MNQNDLSSFRHLEARTIYQEPKNLPLKTYNNALCKKRLLAISPQHRPASDLPVAVSGSKSSSTALQDAKTDSKFGSYQSGDIQTTTGRVWHPSSFYSPSALVLLPVSSSKADRTFHAVHKWRVQENNDSQCVFRRPRLSLLHHLAYLRLPSPGQVSPLQLLDLTPIFTHYKADKDALFRTQLFRHSSQHQNRPWTITTFNDSQLARLFQDLSATPLN